MLFRKSLAKQKNEAVTVHDVTEMDFIWAVVTTARIKLKADYNNTLRQHQWSQAEPLRLYDTNNSNCSEEMWEQNFIEKKKIICLVV